MPNPKSIWWRIKDAPIGKDVLIWIVPLGFAGDAPRMEVGMARFKDARSGIVTQKYSDACRWTELPCGPVKMAGLKEKSHG